MKPMKTGIIGCGNISQAYFNGGKMFRILDVKACADLNLEVARKKAGENGVTAMSVDELLSDPEIELVINLTIPAVHAAVSLQALAAGKHVHSEKPLAIDLAEAQKVIQVAQEKRLRVGCAPDTFLGAGLQTSRKLMDDGWIGRPLSGTIFMMGRGPEGWHPNPAFFYQKGGGPMFDMGPYYITALVHLLGPVKSVTGMAVKGFAQRRATSKERFGELLPVDVPTHNAGVIEFQSGAIITATISFDVHAHGHAPIEIYGATGSLKVPDPNGFGGDVQVWTAAAREWKSVGFTHGYKENSRGIGAADLAYGVRTGRAHRASGELALHVLEVMCAFETSMQTQARVAVATTCVQPAPLPLGLVDGLLDE